LILRFWLAVVLDRIWFIYWARHRNKNEKYRWTESRCGNIHALCV